MNKFLAFAIPAIILSACVQPVEEEQSADPVPQEKDEYCVPGVSCNRATIEDNPNSITLSNETQEEQRKSREAYARRQQEIAAERVEVNTVNVPDTPTTNVAHYARTTSNQLGVKRYSRNRTGLSGCNNYRTSYDAQRAFLEAGGPANDPRNLDKDGDGFACKFDPAPYRNLQAQVDTRTWKQ